MTAVGRLGTRTGDAVLVGQPPRILAAAHAEAEVAVDKDEEQLFVSNAHNTATDSGTISAFTDSRNGTLSSVTSSPLADDQMTRAGWRSPTTASSCSP